MKKPQSAGTQHPSQWRADLCDAPVAGDSTHPVKFKDQYEAAPVEQAAKPVTAKPRPRGENVVDLMDASRQSIGKVSSSPAKSTKNTRNASAGQEEMLMSILGNTAAKKTASKKPAFEPQRKSA